MDSQELKDKYKQQTRLNMRVFSDDDLQGEMDRRKADAEAARKAAMERRKVKVVCLFCKGTAKATGQDKDGYPSGQTECGVCHGTGRVDAYLVSPEDGAKIEEAPTGEFVPEPPTEQEVGKFNPSYSDDLVKCFEQQSDAFRSMVAQALFFDARFWRNFFKKFAPKS